MPPKKLRMAKKEARREGGMTLPMASKRANAPVPVVTRETENTTKNTISSR
jgi:hypothetical protein